MDLVLAFRQADIEFDMYTDIPQVIEKRQEAGQCTSSRSSIIYMDRGKDLGCGTNTSQRAIGNRIQKIKGG